MCSVKKEHAGFLEAAVAHASGANASIDKVFCNDDFLKINTISGKLRITIKRPSLPAYYQAVYAKCEQYGAVRRITNNVLEVQPRQRKDA